MKQKRFLLTSLSLFFSILLSGCSSFGSDLSKKDQGNLDDQPNVILPDYSEKEPEDIDSASILNKITNNLLNSEELLFDSCDFEIVLSNNKTVKIDVKDLKIDLSKLNSIDANLSCSLKVEYDNATIDGLDISMEQDGYIYLKYKGHAYSVAVPRTLDQILELLKALGMNISLTNDSQDKVDIASIIQTIKDVIGNGQIEEAQLSPSQNGYLVTYTVPEIQINDKTSISRFQFLLSADSNYSLTGISLSDFSVNDLSSGNKTLVSLDSSLLLKDISTYERVDKSEYDDLTSSTSSLFQTLTQLGKDKKANIGIQLNLTDSNGKSQNVEGQFMAFASDTFINYDKGDYVLTLEHMNGEKILNDLSVHFQDETLYLTLNQLFKGKIQTTTLSDIFSYVTQIGSDHLIENIMDILNKTLSSTDFDSLINGELSKYEGMVKDFSYEFNQGFRVEFFSQFFGFSKDTDDSFLVAMDIIEGGKDKGLKKIRLENLPLGSYKLSCSLSVNDSSDIEKKEITEEEKNYKNYEAVTPIFKTLVDIVDEKKMQANIALTYKDTSANVGYALNGKIRADMSSITKDDNDLSTIDGGLSHFGKGNYGITLCIDTGKDTMKNQIDVRYQDRNIYFGYNYDDGTYLLKSQFPDSEISEIKDVIDKNTKVGTTSVTASDSIEKTNSLLSAIKNSDGYQQLSDALKEGSLKELDNFVYIDRNNTDSNKMLLEVDPSFFLKGTSYEGKLSAITLAVNTDTNHISSIDFGFSHSLIDKKTDELSVSISFENYEEDLLSEDEKKDYTIINDASKLVGVFYSLPTTFEKFGIEADASVKYKTDDGLDQEILVGDFYDDYHKAEGTPHKSFAAVDMTDINNPVCYGGLGITHPYLGDSTKTANQKIIFDYKGILDPTTLQLSDGQFIFKYNDNMKLSMVDSDVSEIMETVNSIDESNLLYRYLGHIENGTTGLPLMDIIGSKDPSRLLRYKYVKKVEITDTQIKLVASSKLFDDTVDYTTDQDETLIVEYEDNNITKATIEAVMGKYTIKASLTMTAFDKNPKPTMDLSSGYTVDMAGFKTLLKCLVTTTSHNYMEMEGGLKFNIKVIGISSGLVSIEAYAKAKIYISDNTAYVYLNINDHLKNMQDDGYRMTEFFIKEDQIFVNQTRTSVSSQTKLENWSFVTYYTYKVTGEHFYTTADNFTKTENLLYYLLTYSLDIGSASSMANAIIINEIQKSASDSSGDSMIKSNDFSQVINSAELQGNNFHLDLNLDSILSIPAVSLGTSSVIDLGFNTNGEQYLNSLALQLNVSLANIATIEIKPLESSGTKFNQFFLSFTPSRNADIDPMSATGAMSRYYNYTNGGQDFLTPPEAYLITSITPKKNLLGIPSSISISDNGKKQSETYTYTSRNGFVAPTGKYYYSEY